MSALYTEAHGSGGPTVVLLHGWGLNLRVWDPLVPALARRCHVLALDLPGHGHSAWSPAAGDLAGMAQIVQRTLDARDVGSCGPVAVLGWSLGGQLALQLALTAPDRVARLVLVAATPRFVAAADWPHGMAPAVLQRFAAQLAADYRRTVRDFLELQVRGSAGAADVLATLQAALLAHGEARPEALAVGLELLAATDLRERVAAVRQPALVIAGQYDRVTPPGASRALAAALPEARYHEFARAAHAPFLSHADAFAEHVSAFLASPPS